ncbi:MAG: MGMT family protein [Patescibacteria group bacterium]
MNFYQKVYVWARKIPKGKVATYGQIATLITTPRAAQIVGFALRALPKDTDVPWQRIINSHGRISIQNPKWPQSEQARLLRKEGVPVIFRESAFWIDIKKYLYHFSASAKISIKK